MLTLLKSFSDHKETPPMAHGFLAGAGGYWAREGTGTRRRGKFTRWQLNNLLASASN